MKTLHRCRTGPRSDVFVVAATERGDGDFHPRHALPTALRSRQRALNGLSWAMTEQVHGTHVHTVDAGASVASVVTAASRARSDVIVADGADVPLAIWAADCAAIVLIGRAGTVVAAHAGWRGLAASVIDVAVGELGARGDETRIAVLGPVIHPCCYRFGSEDLASVAAGVGSDPEELAAPTSAGERGLDVPAAVGAGLRRHGVVLDAVGSCTACDRRWYSHRRGDTGRHAVVVWREQPEACGGD